MKITEEVVIASLVGGLILFGGVLPWLFSAASDAAVILGAGIVLVVILLVIKFVKSRLPKGEQPENKE